MGKKALLLVFSIFCLALTPIDTQYLRYPGALTNPGFENGKVRWTNSGSGTFSLDTSTNLAMGVYSAAWDAAANLDTLTSEQVSVPKAWYGQACRADFLQKGGDANLTFKVIDGSLATVASVVLATTTNFTEKSLAFTCPTSGTFAVQVLAGANAAVVYLDQVNINLAPLNVSLTSSVTGALPIANGGTGQTTQTAAFDALDPLTTKGDIVTHDGTNSVRLPVGSDGQVLSADSGETAGLRWIAGGLTNPMDSEGDLIVGGVGGAATKLDAGTSTQVLYGGTSPSWGSITTSGTWTPTLTGSGGAFSSVTYVQQQGLYEQVGDIVTFVVDIGWSAASGGTGNLQISGLPVASYSSNSVAQHFTMTTSNLNYSGTDTAIPFASLPAGSSTINVDIQMDNAATASMSVTEANSGTFNKRIRITGSYITD